MRKLKIISTYMIAILSILISLNHNNDISVNTYIENEVDRVVIFIMKNDEIIPISLKQEINKSNIINIENVFNLMKKGIEVIGFETVIPKSIQLLDVQIENKIVKLNFNEALYTMNSINELRFIESIVNSVIQFDEKYQIVFLVNGEYVKKMPLSNRMMKSFDNSIGINNFKLEHNRIDNTVSKYVIDYVNDEIYSYHIIHSIRISKNMDLTSFANYILNKTSTNLICENIKKENNITTLHLNGAFLLDENTISSEKVLNLIQTLKLNGYGDEYLIKVNGETKKLQNNKNEIIKIESLYLNIFEQ